jgi:tetratricopeptide (TPR) repeat protein
MTRKPSRVTRVKGDVNVKNGDVVAGNKTVAHDEDNKIPGSLKPTKIKQTRKARTQVVNGDIGVEGGDVVFGDKIIKFFQKNLNVYIFKDIKQLALFLIVILLVSGGIAGGIWYSRQPKKMTGSFNIVVAQFGEIQPDGTIKPSVHAEKISSTLFGFLDSEYQASGLGMDVQVSHKNMPLIQEDAQAKELANKVNADIVIYGNVFVQEDSGEFSPRFYVAERPDTKELTGQEELANPIAFELSQLGTQDQVNSEIRARTEILLNFTKSLIYFSKKDTDSALRAVQTAITTAEKLPRPFAGQEVLYLLAAKILTGQNKADKANEMLDQSLILNPNYARAYLARGNIYYIQANNSNFDSQLLEKAKAQYELAYQATDQPESAYIPIKAHAALGNIFVVLAQKDNDQNLFSEAIKNYKYVVDEYQRTQDPYLKSYASIAYFGLGAAYERQGKIQDAVDNYRKASDLTDDAEFKTRIEKQIAIAQGVQ